MIDPKKNPNQSINQSSSPNPHSPSHHLTDSASASSARSGAKPISSASHTHSNSGLESAIASSRISCLILRSEMLLGPGPGILEERVRVRVRSVVDGCIVRIDGPKK